MNSKKILSIALLLFSTTEGVLAQSTVTVYGRVDMGVSKENDGESFLPGGIHGVNPLTMAVTPANDNWQVRQGSGSRLGLRGSEDLGGGLKANFNFEHRFNPDTGASTSATDFWRQSWVGLSGGFGELRLGRDYTPIYQVGLASDPWGYSNIAQVGSVHLQGGTALRQNNQIQYISPKLSGFQVRAAIAPTETDNQKNYYSFAGTYGSGPLYLGLAYAHNQRAESAEKTASWILAGAYDFGFARFNAAYSAHEVTGLKSRNITVGATVPVGTGRVLAALSHLRDGEDGVDLKTTTLGLGYEHPLSKRTTLYANLGSGKSTDFDRHTGIQAGMKHNF